MESLVKKSHEATEFRVSPASVCNFTLLQISLYHSVFISQTHPELLASFICGLSRRRLPLKLYCLVDVDNVSAYRVLMNKNEHKEIIHSQGL